jgi:hypothetical protein
MTQHFFHRQDRYDSKYRYYERFPDRQRERLRDPNYDPRWDPLELPAPGVLGGWLPELQVISRGQCYLISKKITEKMTNVILTFFKENAIFAHKK